MNSSKPENFREELINNNEKRILEAARFIGKNREFIKKNLKDVMITAWGKTMMVKPLQSRKDEKGRVIATTRLFHYANTAYIAGQIAKGLFPGDEDLRRGISTIALYHDFGQDPFGHDGEAARTNTSKQNNGGAMLHNIEGMMKINFRYADKIKEALISGRIINEEAKKRNITVEELKEKIEIGLEPELDKRIQDEYEINEGLADEAIKLIAISAGNHNGERGTANIKSDYERTFKETFETAQNTYIDVNEDKNMKSCSIVDAIVKISDQISSITLDIIDGKRAGIEDEIFEGWSEPISKILQITEEEAKEKLKGDDKQLEKLAIQLQRKIIDNVIESSNQREINMTLAPLLYGRTDEAGQVILNGLRTFNLREHTTYTSTAEMEVLLNNAMSDLTDLLAKSVLGEDGAFSNKLNEVFRISSKNPTRKAKEKTLINNFKGDEQLKDFFEYVVDLSGEEYQFNKQIVKKREVQYYRRKIESILKKRANLAAGIELRSPRKSTNYLIEEYMLSPSYEAMIPDENGNYSEEEIKDMIERINVFLHSNPIEGIKHLSLLVERYRYQIGVEGDAEKITTGRRLMNTDQQIAARLALSYLNKLNDEQFLDLACSTGVLSDEERKEFEKPYTIYSGKRTGESGHVTKAMKHTKEAYKAGERE